MTIERWVGLHTGLPHYLDHLGILCVLLDVPLFVTEEKTFETAQKFYPELSVKLVELADLSLDYLASHFEVIFESGHYWASELIPPLELFFNKKMRVVYCPHGNSDKGYSHSSHPRKDISLVYGSHMMDHLKKTKERMSQAVLTGNFRLSYYRAHKQFYDSLLSPHLCKLDPARQTVFYAPSWPDGENPSSFKLYCERVIEEVGEFYNVVIRWHPFLEEIFPAEIEKLLGKYENRNHIAFLHDFPSIYPILDKSDAYLGDFSSVGYDFLALGKPLFFLNHHFGVLYKCGKCLPLQDHFGKSIRLHRETNNLKKIRQEACEYVFGKERSPEEILTDLKAALSQDRPLWTTPQEGAPSQTRCR